MNSFKVKSLKVKLLSIIVSLFIVVELLMIFESANSMKKETDTLINSFKKHAYKAKEKELENYVSLAYIIVESYYKKTLDKNLSNEEINKIKNQALKAVENMKYGKSGYYWVNDSNHVALAHGIKSSLASKNFYNLKDKKGIYLYREIVKTANKLATGGVVKYHWTIPKRKGLYEKFSYVRNFKQWDFIIGTGAYVTDIENEVRKMKAISEENIYNAIIIKTATVFVTLFIIAVIISFVMNKIIFNPLQKLQDNLLYFFKYLNKEQKDINTFETSSNDEIGKMTNIINNNIIKTKKILEEDELLIENVKEIVNNVRKGKIDKRISLSSKNESLEELKKLLNNMLDNIQDLMGIDINELSKILEEYTKRNFCAKIEPERSGKIGFEIDKMNNMITKTLYKNQQDGLNLKEKSNALNSQVNILNKNATHQAASLEETAASVEDITNSITQTSTKAQEMFDISEETKESASLGKKLVNNTVNSMEDINNTVISINEAIILIDKIAFQTNILSLNAAVEAATAGETGKGFAVVAQEVRNLASKSAEVAKQIKNLVEKATIKTDEGKQISSLMIEEFNRLETKITITSDLITDVTKAAKNQSLTMNQISEAINNLDRFTQENANISENTSQIANETNKIAEDIVQHVQVNDFKGKV